MLLNSAVPAFALKEQSIAERSGLEELGDTLQKFASAAGLLPQEPVPSARPELVEGRTVSLAAGMEEGLAIAYLLVVNVDSGLRRNLRTEVKTWSDSKKWPIAGYFRDPEIAQGWDAAQAKIKEYAYDAVLIVTGEDVDAVKLEQFVTNAHESSQDITGQIVPVALVSSRVNDFSTASQIQSLRQSGKLVFDAQGDLAKKDPSLVGLALDRLNRAVATEKSPAAGVEEFMQAATARILEALRSTGPVASFSQLFPRLIEQSNEKNVPGQVPQALLNAFRSLQTDREKRHLTGSLGQAMIIDLHEFHEDFEPDPYPRVLPGRKTIWTVTTSPTIDIDAKRKLANWSDRKGVLVDPGGGGINVAIALARRGVRARPVFFHAGETGKLLVKLIENRGVLVQKEDAIELKGNEQTRVTIITSLDKAGSLVPKGTPVDGETGQRMKAQLLDPQKGVKAGDIVAISGSLAPGLPDDFYADLGRQLIAQGAIVVVDTKGAPAKEVLFSKLPAATIYSQNQLEFGDLVGIDPNDRKALIAKAREILVAQPIEHAIREIVITMGAGGAVSVTREKVLEIAAPKVEAVSEVGAGDTSLAERVFRAWQGKEHDAGFVYGVAAGTASVLHPGTGGGLQAEVDYFSGELGLTEETSVRTPPPAAGAEQTEIVEELTRWVGRVKESPRVALFSPLSVGKSARELEILGLLLGLQENREVFSKLFQHLRLITMDPELTQWFPESVLPSMKDAREALQGKSVEYNVEKDEEDRFPGAMAVNGPVRRNFTPTHRLTLILFALANEAWDVRRGELSPWGEASRLAEKIIRLASNDATAAGAEEGELGLWRKQKKYAPKLFGYRVREADRQHYTINLIASETITPDWILEFMGDVSSNKYAEGYPVSEENPLGRFYPGTEVVDEMERDVQSEWLKVAESIYPSVRSEYQVNVQPHSGSSANAAAYLALLLPRDSLLGMDLISGGHLTHGFRLSFSGIVFDSKQFKVDPKTGKIDYQALREQALKERPHLIVAGGTAYTHPLDWEELRSIADAVTAKNKEEGKDLPPAFLVADVAHNWVQILVGDYPNPFGKAHFITLTTHKSRGPRGGLFYASKEVVESLNRYMGMDPAKDQARIESTSLARRGDMAVIPGLQGGPLENVIMAKGAQAIFLQTEEFRQYAKQIRPNAKALAAALMKDPRAKLMGDGTEVHFVLMNVREYRMMGIQAEKELGKVGITANRNHIPVNKEDEAKLDREFRQNLMNPSGIRIGVPSITARGMKEPEMPEVAELTLDALDNASQRLQGLRTQQEYETVQERIRVRRRRLAERFPVYEEYRKALHAVLDAPAAGAEESETYRGIWGPAAEVLDPSKPFIPARPGDRFLLVPVRPVSGEWKPLDRGSIKLIRLDAPDRVSTTVPTYLTFNRGVERAEALQGNLLNLPERVSVRKEVPWTPGEPGGGAQLVGLPILAVPQSAQQGIRFEIELPPVGDGANSTRYLVFPLEREDLWQAARDHLHELSGRILRALEHGPKDLGRAYRIGISGSRDADPVMAISLNQAGQSLRRNPNNILRVSPQDPDLFLLQSARRESLVSLRPEIIKLQGKLEEFFPADAVLKNLRTLGIIHPVDIGLQSFANGAARWNPAMTIITARSVAQLKLALEALGLSKVDALLIQTEEGKPWSYTVQETDLNVPVFLFGSQAVRSAKGGETVFLQDHPWVSYVRYPVSPERMVQMFNRLDEQVERAVPAGVEEEKDFSSALEMILQQQRAGNLDSLIFWLNDRSVYLSGDLLTEGNIRAHLQSAVKESPFTTVFVVSTYLGKTISVLPAGLPHRYPIHTSVSLRPGDWLVLKNGHNVLGRVASAAADGKVNVLNSQNQPEEWDLEALAGRYDYIPATPPVAAGAEGKPKAPSPAERGGRQLVRQFQEAGELGPLPMAEAMVVATLLGLEDPKLIFLIPNKPATRDHPAPYIMTGQLLRVSVENLALLGKTPQVSLRRGVDADLSDLYVRAPISGLEFKGVIILDFGFKPPAAGAEQTFAVTVESVIPELDVPGGISLQEVRLRVDDAAAQRILRLRGLFPEDGVLRALRSKETTSWFDLHKEKSRQPFFAWTDGKTVLMLEPDALVDYYGTRGVDDLTRILRKSLPPELAQLPIELARSKNLRINIESPPEISEGASLRITLQPWQAAAVNAEVKSSQTGLEQAQEGASIVWLSFNPAAGIPLRNAGLEEVFQVAADPDDAFRQARLGFPPERLIGAIPPGREESDYTALVPEMRLFSVVEGRTGNWEAAVYSDVSARLIPQGRRVIPVYDRSTLAAGLEQMGIPEPVIQQVMTGLGETYDTLNQMQ